MSARQALAACAAIVFMAVPQARAADFGGDSGYPPYGSDRGYAEEYRDDGSSGYAPDGGEYYEGQGDQYPPPDGEPSYQGSIKDGYPVPQPPPYKERYSERYEGPGPGCISGVRIKHSLRAQGWIDLRPLEAGGRLATVKARRQGTGEKFILKLDNCSGEIVHARPQYLRTYGEYDRRPWRRYSWRRY